MDHTRDNPLKRFTAFWVALLLVTAFGIALLILRPMTHARVNSATEAAAEQRRAIRSEVDSAQLKSLNTEALNKALEASAKSLSSIRPTPGAIAVPGAALESASQPAPAAQPEPASE